MKPWESTCRLDDQQIYEALERMGLVAAGERPALEPMTGGISSVIYRVDMDTGPIVIKHPLPQLRVKKDWFAPVERSRLEVQWIKTAGAIAPGSAPTIVGHDPEHQVFAMAYLDPLTYRVWKGQLRRGEIDPKAAARLGKLLATYHAQTANDAEIAALFDGGAEYFFALRIEAYLLATAAVHPTLAPIIHDIAKTTQDNCKALVHGDFSPKNILMGPDGPVVLDAETANYGDPAFDLAFCLNHLLLKCIWQPHWIEGYMYCFDHILKAYLMDVDWEPAAALERRATHLLPALLLARIDGKSPAEYISEPTQQDFVRKVATDLLHPTSNNRAPDTLADVKLRWHAALKDHFQ
jgi:fructosamine-3-kinase